MQNLNIEVELYTENWRVLSGRCYMIPLLVLYIVQIKEIIVPQCKS